jgi:hypothetical protein
MKIYFIFFLIFLCFACDQFHVSAQSVSKSKIIKNKPTSIFDIDFRNFTFPWTKSFGNGETKKSFTLKNGRLKLAREFELSIASINYGNVSDDYDNDQALILIKIDDGNATYQMLYVYAFKDNKAKLLQNFEFGENNIYYGTSFIAHSELVIGRYIQKSGDSECCPSVFELSFYRWQNNKFILQGESQTITNNYVERVKKKSMQ